MSRSALLLQLLAIFVGLCCCEDSTTSKPEDMRAGNTLENAMVVAGVMAVSIISVAVVLAPTVLYHNYRTKRELEQNAQPIVFH